MKLLKHSVLVEALFANALTVTGHFNLMSVAVVPEAFGHPVLPGKHKHREKGEFETGYSQLGTRLRQFMNSSIVSCVAAYLRTSLL